MARDTARVPLRGPTATSISLSLNGATLSNILLTNNFFFHCSYVGSVVDGEPHGQGTYTWANGERCITSCVNLQFLICSNQSVSLMSLLDTSGPLSMMNNMAMAL